MSDMFSVNVSAMNAAQIGLTTTEHNIANASTPGFTRQAIVSSAAPAQLTGAGYVGTGVDVTTVQRAYNEFLSGQVVQQQGISSQLNSYYSQIQQINNLLADPTVGVSPALQNFFNSVNTVASSPESMAARQTMLSTAHSLTSTFQSLNQQLTNLNSSINGQITTSVTTIDSYAQQIAGLNKSIVLAQAASAGLPPNDLLDQRDQLITQLNKEVNATVVKQGDGSYNVSVGSGQLLVVGGKAYGLQAVQSKSSPSQLEVAAGTSSGAIVRLQQSSITGGNLGGLLAFRSQSLSQTQNQLGLIATGVAGTFNQQNQLGQDLNGNPASVSNSFFTDPVPVVNSNTANTGNGVVTAGISDYSKLVGSDYSLAYDGTNYTLTRLSDNTSASYSSLPQTVDGVNISLVAGTNPAAGDSFIIHPTINGAANMAVTIIDPARIAAASPVMTNALGTNSGSALISASALDLAGTNVMPSATGAAAFSFSATPATLTVDGTNVTVNQDVTVTGTGNGPGTLAASIQAGLNAAGLTSYSVSAAPAPGGGLQIIRTGSNSAVSVTNVNDPSGNIVAGTGTSGPIYTAATAAMLPATLKYDSATKTFSGFPPNLPVTVTTNSVPPTSTTYPAPAGAVPYTDGATIDFGGINFSISGTPTNGDQFTVAHNTNATTDNRNVLLLAGLQAQNTMLGGTANYQGVYSQLVSQVGNKTREMQVNSTAQTTLLNQSIQAQQSVSGVNLDEEAANLLRYQQAYQAAGKAMQIASTLFETLLTIGR